MNCSEWIDVSFFVTGVRDHQNRRPVGPGPTDIRSGRQNFGPCRPDGPIKIWPNPNFVWLFIYTFSGTCLSKIVLAKTLKGIEKDYICVYILSLRPLSPPPSSLCTMYKCQPNKHRNNVWLFSLVKFRPEASVFFGRASNFFEIIKSGNNSYFYLFFIDSSIFIRKKSLAPWRSYLQSSRLFYIKTCVVIIIRNIGDGSFITMV